VKRPNLVIFDFDGTLANTGPLICACFAAAVEGTAAQRTTEEFRPLLGHPLERVHAILSREVPAFDLSVEDFVLGYQRQYRALGEDMTSLFPGVSDVLNTLDMPLAIASTKPTPVLLRQSIQLGIHGHFSHIQGTDGFAHKPDPEVIHRVWSRVPASADRTLFVGDSTMDMEAGRAAGVRVVGVTTGAHDRSRLLEAGAQQVVDHLGELVADGPLSACQG
jgi:phosphoglycolate phosphatase